MGKRARKFMPGAKKSRLINVQSIYAPRVISYLYKPQSLLKEHGSLWRKSSSILSEHGYNNKRGKKIHVNSLKSPSIIL